MMLLPVGAMAQDAVHGVDGYYNFTPTQMKASGQWAPGGNGKKKSGYYPELRYTDDMTYAKFNLGVNKDEASDLNTYPFRSELVLNEISKGDGCMTITSAYPVIAFKFSAPVNNEPWKEGGDFGYFEPEFSWYSPYSTDGTGQNPGQTSGNKMKLQLSGLDNNGRFRFAHYHSVLKDEFGRDSVYLNNNNGQGYSKYRLINNNKDTVWHVLRVMPNTENPEMADIIIGMNLAVLKNNSGDVLLDSCSIKMKGISLGFLGVNATLEGKTQDELPFVYFKWLKTFPSMAAFEASLCDEQNWGDGPAIDPNKAVLNSEMYALRQLILNYQFSDKKNILMDAYTAAQTVYNAAGSTSADYATQVEAIATAKQEFMAAIVYVPEEPMIKFYSWTGMALGLTTQDVTVGSYTGRALTPVSAENAVAFMLTKSGEINGQACYNVLNGSNTMVRASDGQLLFVPASQIGSASAKANLVLSNRRTVDEPAYDFKVDQFFYYIDVEETGEFLFTDALPDAEDMDELAAYMVTPQGAGEYDPADHNQETHPMTSGEGSWNEFNGTVDVVINPAYETSFQKYDWDATVKATAMERAKQNQFEGWRTNGWRLRELIEAATLDGGEKVMKVTLKPEYDLIHNDSVSASMAVTDFSSNQFSIMREHGAYNSALNKAPINNQQCDSLWAININSGINRYFAIKWKGNTDDITFNGLTFFVRKNIEEPGVGMSTLKEKRGDVYIWDLLDCGIPYGDRKACAQYMSWNGVKAATDAVYVDWMRFYDSLDAIPTESMDVPDAIRTISSAQASTVTFYDLNGRKISSRRPTTKGVYIMTNGTQSYKIVVK